MRSTGGCARAGFGVEGVLWPVGSPYEITKMPRSRQAPEQFTGPKQVKKLEIIRVIPQHAVRARKIFRRFLDPYGRHRACSWKLSLHA